MVWYAIAIGLCWIGSALSAWLAVRFGRREFCSTCRRYIDPADKGRHMQQCESTFLTSLNRQLNETIEREKKAIGEAAAWHKQAMRVPTLACQVEQLERKLARFERRQADKHANFLWYPAPQSTRARLPSPRRGPPGEKRRRVVSEYERDEIVMRARQLYESRVLYPKYFAAVFGLRGLVRTRYPDQSALLAYRATPAHRQLQQWLSDLTAEQSGRGVPVPSPRRPTPRVITVRVSPEMHKALRAEAWGLHISLNALCVARLSDR